MYLRIITACQKCLGVLSYDDNGTRCTRCGSFFPVRNDVYYFVNATSVPPKPAKPRSRWTKWRKMNFAYFQKNLANLSPDSLVLDVGAGPGQFKDLYKKCRYVGIDFCPYDGVRIVSDITKQFPFRQNVFDYAILSNVLEHLPEPKNALRECFRVLKPGGVLILTVPFVIHVHQEPYDFLRYTQFMLEYMLSNAGFSVQEIVKMGTIFDLQKTFVNGAFSVYKKNLRKNVRGRLLRIPATYILLAAQKMTLGILNFTQRFFDDTINDVRGTSIAIGYGAVAEKK